jgi:hypothetical protein
VARRQPAAGFHDPAFVREALEQVFGREDALDVVAGRVVALVQLVGAAPVG